MIYYEYPDGVIFMFNCSPFIYLNNIWSCDFETFTEVWQNSLTCLSMQLIVDASKIQEGTGRIFVKTPALLVSIASTSALCDWMRSTIAFFSTVLPDNVTNQIASLPVMHLSNVISLGFLTYLPRSMLAVFS